LKHNKNINLCAYFNYHSTGEVIYQRPYDKFNEIKNKSKTLTAKDFILQFPR